MNVRQALSSEKRFLNPRGGSNPNLNPLRAFVNDINWQDTIYDFTVRLNLLYCPYVKWHTQIGCPTIRILRYFSLDHYAFYVGQIISKFILTKLGRNRNLHNENGRIKCSGTQTLLFFKFILHMNDNWIFNWWKYARSQTNRLSAVLF